MDHAVFLYITACHILPVGHTRKTFLDVNAHLLQSCEESTRSCPIINKIDILCHKWDDKKCKNIAQYPDIGLNFNYKNVIEKIDRDGFDHNFYINRTMGYGFYA